MIEVLFGESEAASMKAAKNKIVIGGADGPTAVWIAGKKRPPERGSFEWIEGTGEEVVCLGFLLDIGDIRMRTDSSYRKDLIYSMYAQEQWGRDDEVDEELRNAGECYCMELKRLERFLEEGEAVRIWYSKAPYSLCGFYFLCSILKEYGNEIRAVKLPEHIQNALPAGEIPVDCPVDPHGGGHVAGPKAGHPLDGEPPVVGNLPQADAQDVLQGVQQAVAVVDPAGGAIAHLRGVLDPGLVVQGGIKCIFAL